MQNNKRKLRKEEKQNGFFSFFFLYLFVFWRLNLLLEKVIGAAAVGQS